MSVTTIEGLGTVSTTEANVLRYITDRLDGILRREGTVATHASPATFHTSEGLLRLGGFKNRQSLEQTLVAHFKAIEPAPKIKVLRISENLVSISIIKP